MDAWELRSHIEAIEGIPTIPVALRRLLEVIENPKVSLSEIGSFILKDPAITSRLLKVVNSPVYGFPGRISTVSQALIMLGLDVARGVLLGVSVFDIMDKVLSGLWEHSVGCAIVARTIARMKSIDNYEEVSVAALLHDIGKVVLGLKFPDKYEKTISDAGRRNCHISDSERRVFEVTHAIAGAWLLEKWKFPINLVEAVEHHHKPHLSKNAPLMASVVHFSDIVIRARGIGFAGDNIVPAINSTAWEMLELTERDLKEVLQEIEEALANKEDSLFI